MSTRPTLKSYFKKGATPTESQFADLIDSTPNFDDDPLVKSTGGPLGVEAVGQDETLLNFYRVEQDGNKLSWQLAQNPGGKSGFAIASGGSNPGETTPRLFIDSATGKLGIATTSPQSQLAVAGGLTVGASYAGVHAAPANGLLVEGSVGIGTTDPSMTGTGRTLAVGRGPSGIYGLVQREEASRPWRVSLATEGQERLSVLALGGVGVGTTAPKSPLAVAGGLAVGANYAGANAAPANGLLVEGSVGIGTPDPSMARMTRTLAVGRGFNGIYGLTQLEQGNWRMSLATEGQERLSILDAGNVGIGTTAPKSLLAVAGGLTVGERLAGREAAPDNGLLVQGNVEVRGQIFSAHFRQEAYADNVISTTAGNFVDIPDMKITVTSNGPLLFISFLISEAWNERDFTSYRLMIDDNQLGGMNNHFVSRHSSIGFQRLIKVAPGQHTIIGQWKTTGGSKAQSNGSRCLIVMEV